jgi:menaquinone-dependent protoporphyrinogen oxidase
MSRILILYSTTDGHTKKICSRLAQHLESNSNEVQILNLNTATQPHLQSADKIVIGASIRYGKHQQSVYNFIKQNRELLTTIQSAFFTVNVVARKPDKNTPTTNPYLKKFLRQVKWQPASLAVFAGKIDFQRYRFLDRHMIRFIMWMTKGPTNLQSAYEFTDWDKVIEFAHVIDDL